VERVVGGVIERWVDRAAANPGAVASEARPTGTADVRARLMAAFRAIGHERGRISWVALGRDVARWCRQGLASTEYPWP
jgi:hypothetical protein